MPKIFQNTQQTPLNYSYAPETQQSAYMPGNSTYGMYGQSATEQAGSSKMGSLLRGHRGSRHRESSPDKENRVTHG